MNAQSQMYMSFPHLQAFTVSLWTTVPPCACFYHSPDTPGGNVFGCVWQRQGGRGRGRRGVVGPSFMLNKATVDDRLGMTSQAETGPLPFLYRGSLRRGGRDSTICLLREKSMLEWEDVFVRYVSVCVFAWSRRDINRQGGVGPSLSHCLFCLQKQTPLNQPCSTTKRQRTTRVNKEPPSCLHMDSNPLSTWWLLMRE